MHKPRFLDQFAMDLGDREAFTVAFARGRRAFQPQHVEAKWARDRAANINHIKLEVTLDFDAKKISGTATHRLSAIAGPLERLEFDATELEIKAVRAGGEPATFETADGKLLIDEPSVGLSPLLVSRLTPHSPRSPAEPVRRKPLPSPERPLQERRR